MDEFIEWVYQNVSTRRNMFNYNVMILNDILLINLNFFYSHLHLNVPYLIISRKSTYTVALDKLKTLLDLGGVKVNKRTGFTQ